MIFLGGHRRNLHSVEGGAGQQVLDFGIRFDVAAHARALGGIPQPVNHFFAAAFLGPARQCGLQAGAAGGVRVLARGDVEASRASRVDERADLAHAAPVRFRPNFQVVDDDGQVRRLADLNGFPDRFLHAKTLAADV